MAEETVFYDTQDVKVTNARFMVGATTYPLSGITSVRSVKVIEKRSPAIWTIIIGIIITFIGFSISTGVGVFGLVVLGIGVLWLIAIKDSFVLKMATASGETDALQEKGNGERITKIASALNEAIVHRG